MNNAILCSTGFVNRPLTNARGSVQNRDISLDRQGAAELGLIASCIAAIELTLRKRMFPLAAALALAVAAQAQTSRGTVTGTILDASGAVIAGARVTLTGVDTGVRLSTDSNQACVYRFDAVDLGVYELKVVRPG